MPKIHYGQPNWLARVYMKVMGSFVRIFRPALEKKLKCKFCGKQTTKMHLGLSKAQYDKATSQGKIDKDALPLDELICDPCYKHTGLEAKIRARDMTEFVQRQTTKPYNNPPKPSWFDMPDGGIYNGGTE